MSVTITIEYLQDFLFKKGTIEAIAIVIAKRISELNPKERFLTDVVSVAFFEDENDKSVSVTTGGNARGYYEESINFPMSFLYAPDWEQKYMTILDEQKSNELRKIEIETKNKEQIEINQLKELKKKYPNL
jgi:hypothetical protein